MGSGIRFRPWRPADRDAALEVLERTHREDRYPVVWPDDPASFAHPEDAIASWVAEGGDSGFIGHVCVRPAHGPPLAVWQEGTARSAGTLGMVSRLYVNPAARRQGAARLLLAKAVGAIEERGQVPVLDVLWRYDRAIRLYEAQGWTRIGMFVWPMPDGSEEPAYGYALVATGADDLSSVIERP